MKKRQFMNQENKKNRDITRIPVSEARQMARPVHAGLLMVTLVLICFGLVMLFSASMTDAYSRSGDALYYVLKQAGLTTLGLFIALFIALMLPVRLFDHFWMTLVLYAGTTGLLVYVKFFGLIINGARRWVDLGVQFQPSELAKITMIFCFAGYGSYIRRMRKEGRLRYHTPLRQFIADGWLDVLLPACAFLVWIALVAWQPHLSGALILCFILGVVFLTAGIRFRSWISALTQFLILALVLILVFSLVAAAFPASNMLVTLQESVAENFEHVGNRLDAFFHPESVSRDDTYQATQSLIAIGSGGLTGVGLGEGRQKYNYLPEAHNDYVFAIIGEELGFAGTAAIVLLFLLFMYMGIAITRRASAFFPAVLAGGYTMLISVQAFLNMAVATRTIPATGVSLPFFSYGGTSNLLFLVAIGFILAVSRSGQRRSQPVDYKTRSSDLYTVNQSKSFKQRNKRVAETIHTRTMARTEHGL